MIEVTHIRIQTLNGDIVTRQENIKNIHTFKNLSEMEAWRFVKQMKLQYKSDIRHLAAGGDPEHLPTVFVALTYRDKIENLPQKVT